MPAILFAMPERLLNTIFSPLIKSVTDVTYYKSVLAAPVRNSAWFFIIWVGITGLFRQAYQLSVDMPYWTNAATRAGAQLVANYPQDLQITWDGSQLKSTRDPLVVAYPDQFVADSQLAAALPPNLASFTANSSSVSTSSALAVTSTHLSLQLPDQSPRSIPLVEVLGDQSLTITSSTIEQDVKNFLDQHLSNSLQLFALLSSLLYLISLYLSRLITVLLESALLTIMLSFTSLKIGYANVCKLSLHVVVLAGVIDAIASVIDPAGNGFWFSLSYWILMIYVLAPIIMPKIRLPQAPTDLDL